MKLKLEEAIKYLKIIKDTDLEKVGYPYGVQAIEIVLQKLNDLQEKNKILIQYLDSQGLVNDYLRYKSIRNRRCK